MKNIRLAVFGLAFASLAALGACALQPGASNATGLWTA